MFESGHKRKLIIRALALVLCYLIAFPVGLAEEIERRSKVSDLARSTFEKDLEQRLSRDIKAYLNHEFFIVQINAQLENIEKWDISEVVVPVEPPPQAPPQAAPQAPPPVPAIDEKKKTILSQMELDTKDGINSSILEKSIGVDTALPGVPLSDEFIEEERKRLVELEQLKQELKQKLEEPPKAEPPAPPPPVPQVQTKKEKVEKLLSKQEAIRKLNAKVMLDEHVSPEQEVFIRNLVIEKADLSFLRGDELRILRSKFPAASVLDEPVEEEPKPEEVPEEAAETPAEEPPTWWEENWQYVLAAGAILALLLLWLFVRRREKAPVNTEPMVVESEASRKLEELIRKMHEKVDTVNENRLGAIKEEIVSLAVTDQEMVSEQIKEWLGSASEDDKNKSGLLYQMLGEGLYRGLAHPVLTPEKQIAVVGKILEIEEMMSPDEKLALAENVFQAMMQRRYQQQHDLRDENKPFAFLEKLNDDQILYLLKEEPLKVKALVMSQLSSNRGASLLKRFNIASRSKIAMEISQFAKLPVSAFRDIANRLAKKAVHVPSYENLEVEGIDLLTDMLDHMNSAEETALLKSLQRENPDLYYAIRQVYVSFDDIVQIPTLGLKNVIRELDREVLALALYDADESYRGVIFGTMLERPRAMLQSSIKALGVPEPDAVNDAKRKVSRQARAMLKAGVFEMPSGKPNKKTTPNEKKSA
ncbi:MAG: hypothetical protein OEZ43_09805 [Gammaproteobacteria bacterium]|nr:hypothetical protein [Gammaproteobacteria bacterium]